MSDSTCIEHGPCPAPECGSSDACGLYTDGHRWCFSCGRYFHADGTEGTAPGESSDDGAALPSSLLSGESVALLSRRITQATCAKFKYLTNEDEHAQIATYFDASGRPVAQKVRGANKAFRWVGEPKKATLFGAQLWAGGGQRIVITEGEIDALSVSQAFNNRWPVVSIPNGAQGARKDLMRHIEYLESFDKIVLMFDNDEPGKKAAAECAELFTPGKCAIAQLPLKDANEMLVAERAGEIASAVFQAKVVRPDGILNGDSLWAVVSQDLPAGMSYPWARLNQIARGMRTAEITTWCAGTGIGKSQFLREVVHHLVTRHDQRVGVIALEESVRDTALGQMSLAANRRLHLPEVRAETSKEQLAEYFKATLGTGRYVLYDHFGSVDAATLIPKIRYMVLVEKCKWVVLDHISIVVSGYAAEGDERKRIDELMTKLRQLCQELDFGLHIVSHLRRGTGETSHEEGGRVTLADLRGSGAIGQVSNMIFAIERNPQAHGEAKSRSKVRVLKNRYTGEQGEAGVLTFDGKTGRLLEFFDPEPDPMTAPEKTEGDY